MDMEGGERLISLGGEGTPLVSDLCLGELSIARGVHLNATRAAMADALDLRHRLPRLWHRLRALELEAWVARKIAAMTRPLSREAATLVDATVAAAVAQSPGRLLTLAEAVTIEADQERRRADLAAARAATGVWLSSGRDDLPGLRTIYARLEAADAIWLDATVQRVADALAADPDLRTAHHPHLGQTPSPEELRAAALGWLSRPEDLAALLGVLDQPASPSGAASRKRREATLYVHLHQAALDGTAAIARAEELGPLLLEQVTALLGHAHISLKPVIDLTHGRSVNAYEFPADIRERAHLRMLGDVFPYATSHSRRLDADHPTPFNPHGPPGQTGDHNLAPLGRRHHRIKTHLAYKVEQLGPTTYRWTTPHGLIRWVDPTGTHRAGPAP